MFWYKLSSFGVLCGRSRPDTPMSALLLLLRMTMMRRMLASCSVVIDVHAAHQLCDKCLQGLWAHLTDLQDALVVDRLCVIIALHYFVGDEGQAEHPHATVASNQYLRGCAHTCKNKWQLQSSLWVSNIRVLSWWLAIPRVRASGNFMNKMGSQDHYIIICQCQWLLTDWEGLNKLCCLYFQILYKNAFRMWRRNGKILTETREAQSVNLVWIELFTHTW